MRYRTEESDRGVFDVIDTTQPRDGAAYVVMTFRQSEWQSIPARWLAEDYAYYRNNKKETPTNPTP